MTAAQQALVAANTKLAWQYVHRGADTRIVADLGRDEAYSQACLGLCNAARSYDPSKGAFSTWAYVFMRQALQTTDKRTKSYGVQFRPCPVFAASALLDPHQEDDDLFGGLAGYRDPIHERAETAEMWERVAALGLPEREFAMLRMRAEGMTLEAIGDRYGIGKERVRQLIVKATAAARQAFAADNFEEGADA